MGKKTRRLMAKLDASPVQVHGSAWTETGKPSGGWAEGRYERTIPGTGGATLEGYARADVGPYTKRSQPDKPNYTGGIRLRKKF